MVENIGNGTEIPYCTLRAGKDFLSPVCRAKRTGKSISLEFVSFPGAEKESFDLYLNNLPAV